MLIAKLDGLRAASAFRAQSLPALVCLTDAPRQGPFGAIVDALAAAGSWVIFRDYAMPPAERAEAAARARELCSARGITLFVARDLDLALRIGAEGFHCPQSLIPSMASWRHAHPGLLFSAACHDEDSLRQACEAGATFALVSPVFPTRSHPGVHTMGTAHLRALVQSVPSLPVYAMGGVTARTMGELIDAGSGVAGVAGIDLVADLAGAHIAGERLQGCEI
ncbi:thiamine phosphate synthase superfamily [Pavlovales sp. CCMP2436]|nr:thiamine phosphate synthase superfamily [Pavlovales sp. CCMP2436]